MKDFLPFALPDITEREIAAVTEVMRSGWLTTGTKAMELETKFAQAVSAPHALAVNSCTAALHLALEALGVGPEHEVIVPAMTFTATAEVVRYLGARPVIVDVRPDDHQIDPSAVERAITKKTRAVIPVHFAGQPCDLDPILELCRARGVAVVEDAAHAFPVAYKGRPVGSIGDLTCFSFYATKTITTGEGGMVTTADAKLAERIKLMRLHGISKDAWKRYSAEGSWYYEVLAPGFKYNLTDMAAALGLVQLERAEEMRARRAAIARDYTAALGKSDALELLPVHQDRGHAWHLFVVRLVDGVLKIDRARFIEELKARGVGTSVHFIPLHLHPFWRELSGLSPKDLPASAAVYERSLSLPIYSKMTDEEVQRVIGAVSDLVRTHRR